MRTSMKIAAIALAMVSLSIGRTQAEECRTFGTRPACNASPLDCPSGWKFKDFDPRGCFGSTFNSGSRVVCCKQVVCSQFGTPGCPYPKFGFRDRPADRPPLKMIKKLAPLGRRCPVGLTGANCNEIVLH